MSISKYVRPEIDLSELYAKVPNRFLLTVAAAKRARQILDGARPLIEANLSNNLALDIALMEIQLGKIVVSIEDQSDEESIIDEISDYLDSDILEETPPPSDTKGKKDLKKKRKSLAS